MGRANVYLPDDLERRVKAAPIPVSEVCQQALLKAVEAAESSQAPLLGAAVAGAYRQGAQAGEQWARAASRVTLLTLLRDRRLDEIPTDHLPGSWYSLNDELTTAWEAGFVEAARAVARVAVDVPSGSDPAPDDTATAEPDDPSDPAVEELVHRGVAAAGGRFHQLHRAGPDTPHDHEVRPPAIPTKCAGTRQALIVPAGSGGVGIRGSICQDSPSKAFGGWVPMVIVPLLALVDDVESDDR